MKRFTLLLLALSFALFLTGCLSVIRIPSCFEKYSDEGVCTNRVWTSFLDEKPSYRIYPTIKMRCHATYEWWKPIDPEVKGRDLYQQRMYKHWGWVPLSVIWITSPVDAVVDTLFLPWDWYQLKD